jgi:CRISPR-associated endoribonuclease Cas6
MLISIVLTLVSETHATLPHFLGRANYAATLAALGRSSPALAAAIHDGEGPKPLTCSSLLDVTPRRDGQPVYAGRPVAVRVTGLAADVGRALEDALLGATPAAWELDGHPFAVQGATCDPAIHPWAGRTSFEALAAASLGAQGAERSVTLEFAAPVSFKSGGVNVPVPLPGLLFGSLVERWNAFSPVALSPEMRRFGEEMVALSRYKLESRSVDQKNGALRIGGVGTATYRALGSDRYWLGVMQMLAAFALYGGVGVQTATGMGQARRVERAAQPSPGAARAAR